MSATSGAGGFLSGFTNSFFPGMRANDQMELERQQDARRQALVDQQLSAYQQAQKTEAANRALAANPAMLQRITAEVPQGYLNQDLQTVKDYASPGFMMQMRNYRTPEQEMQDDLSLYGNKRLIDKQFAEPKPANIKLIEMDGPEGPGQYIYNVDTQQARKIGGVVAEGGESGPNFKGEMELRKEYSKQLDVFNTAKYQLGVIEQAAIDPGPAGDIGLIFGIMKMFDPGSVVRESEFAVAQGAGSFYQKLSAKYENMTKGERLTDEQREDFVNTATRIYRGVLDEAKYKTKYYRDLAVAYRMDPNRVTFDSKRWEPAERKKTADAPKSVDKNAVTMGR